MSDSHESQRPGRSCPLHYRYALADFARAPDFTAPTLYVIGGLYGNVPALEAIFELAASEPTPVTFAFNGDFNWFNVDGVTFQTINTAVLRHHAIRGNVETELADDDDSAGCGCAYPDYVDDAAVARSNDIMARLRSTARQHTDLRARLGALPMHRVAEVGGLRVAIVHGDLQSLAGWSLAEEFLEQHAVKNSVIKQLLMSKCSVVASSHTCLPVALSLRTAAGNRMVFNNGAAGMPNFRGTHFGVITRIAVSPAPVAAKSLYGARTGDIHIDAMPVHYDHARWQREFLANWPIGSAAHQSYFQRITHGPDYAVTQANRLSGRSAGYRPGVSIGVAARLTAVA